MPKHEINKNDLQNLMSNVKLNDGDKVMFDLGHEHSLTGMILSQTTREIKVLSTIDGTDHILKLKKEQPLEKCSRESKLDVDDMINMNELSQLAILENLRNRYEQQKIYTYIGDILVAINPYTSTPFDHPHLLQSFLQQDPNSLEPHVYGLASRVYRAVNAGTNQVVIIGGESGAGKTEVFKKILQFLSVSSRGEETDYISNKILETTAILESFGHAATQLNSNSSRFGKYVDLFFLHGRICGAKITKYLLEKTRVTFQSARENSFHVFYEFTDCLEPEIKKKHYLTELNKYAYTGYAKKQFHHLHSTKDGFAAFQQSWSNLNLNDEEMDLAVRVISSILHLGNLQFAYDETKQKLNISNRNEATVVMNELELNEEQLECLLTKRPVETKNETIWTSFSVAAAIVNRDSIAKWLYDLYFDDLIDKLNQSINIITGKETNYNIVGLLDIYGFENVPNNSLEQFCINYANENLQKVFNSYIFTLEQDMYRQEGINWTPIVFPDNQLTLELIAKPPCGITFLCDDEASLSSGNDTTFLMNCVAKHSKHPCFELPKFASKEAFTVRHYAGKTVYTVSGFIEKNRDCILVDKMEVLMRSRNPGIASFFMKLHEQRSLERKNSFKAHTTHILHTFHNSLSSMLEMIKTYQPSFVRCIVPNQEQKVLLFDDALVANQLRYCGLLETVKIRKAGFPVRYEFKEFVKKFLYLLPASKRDTWKHGESAKKEAVSLIQQISPNLKVAVDYAVGKSKLFLRLPAATLLDGQKDVLINHSAKVIQKTWRRCIFSRIARRRFFAILRIQAWYRGYKVRKLPKVRAMYEKRQHAALFPEVKREEMEEFKPEQPRQIDSESFHRKLQLAITRISF